MKADDITSALQIGRWAQAAARKSGNRKLIQYVAAGNKQLRALEQMYADARTAIDKLKENPTDPEANLTAGTYYSFVKNEWDKGLPLLAKGSDPELKNSAKRI